SLSTSATTSRADISLPSTERVDGGEKDLRPHLAHVHSSPEGYWGTGGDGGQRQPRAATVSSASVSSSTGCQTGRRRNCRCPSCGENAGPAVSRTPAPSAACASATASLPVSTHSPDPPAGNHHCQAGSVAVSTPDTSLNRSARNRPRAARWAAICGSSSTAASWSSTD